MGGIPELIRDGVTGLMFEAGNPDDLENKIKLLLETPMMLETFTANCKESLFETPETYYQQLLKIYGDKE